MLKRELGGAQVSLIFKEMLAVLRGRKLLSEAKLFAWLAGEGWRGSKALEENPWVDLSCWDPMQVESGLHGTPPETFRHWKTRGIRSEKKLRGLESSLTALKFKAPGALLHSTEDLASWREVLSACSPRAVSKEWCFAYATTNPDGEIPITQVSLDGEVINLRRGLTRQKEEQIRAILST